MTKKYDFVIVGSGIGGLMTAFVLSKKGYQVCLLEKNGKLGGTLQAYKRNGRMLGTGMHYIGSLDKGQMMYSIFKYFGLFDGIEYQRMDEKGFDVFNIAGKEIKYPMGLNNLRRQFYNYFPDEKDAIDHYITGLVNTVKEQNVYALKEEEVSKKWDK